MKTILFLIIFLPTFVLAQTDVLLWKPFSSTDPIYELSVSCDPRHNLVFDGVYRDVLGVKASYKDINGKKFFVYKYQMTFVSYNIEVWSDSIVTIFYNEGEKKCTLTFRVKSAPEELWKLFEGIPGHKGF